MATLIIYATKYGTTARVAEMLKSKLPGEIKLINIAKERVPSLEGFENVIIGGSIYISKIQKEISRYAKANLEQLLEKRIGLFICAAEPEPICSKEFEEAFPAELHQHASGRAIIGYAYALDQMSFIDRLMVKKIKGVGTSETKISKDKIEILAKCLG